MIPIITPGSLFGKWLDFTSNQSIVECDFFNCKEEPVAELLGEFVRQRMSAFGEHASGSLLSFYNSSQQLPVDEVPVAWLDSEGTPCVVISKNSKEFLSILPYGMGFAYTVAAVIENNLGDADILEKARSRINKTNDELLAEARQRFIDLDRLLQWLTANNIAVEKDPIALIINSHNSNSDLMIWIAENS